MVTNGALLNEIGPIVLNPALVSICINYLSRWGTEKPGGSIQIDIPLYIEAVHHGLLECPTGQSTPVECVPLYLQVRFAKI